MVPGHERRRSRLGLPAVLGWLLALALMSGVAESAAGSGVVVTPDPGDRVTRHPVRVVVRAGPEHGDLRAKLNGVRVGEEFARASVSRRVLRASNSHGLRYGRNVLRVVAEKAGTVRRQTVKFRVSHRRPMAGAGRDLRVPVGARAEIGGTTDGRQRGERRPHPLRWRVVRAPRQARLSSSSDAQRAAALHRALRSPRTATPAFRPDVMGRYVLELTVGSGRTATTDKVAVDAVPAVGQVELDTGIVEGGGVFGIKVGNRVLQAPPMHQDGSSVSWVGSSSLWSHYAALWQVLVLDRATLQVNSNRTYGYCTGPQGEGICEKGEDGEPILVIDPAGSAARGSAAALRQQLLNLGPKYIVVAANHYDNGLAWGNFDTASIATNALSAIGFPSKPSQGLTAGGSAAAIGVPGVRPGRGDFQIAGSVQRMRGYLTPDPLDHFDFIPLARQPFDTRASASCVGSTCTMTMSVGGQEKLWPGAPGPAPQTITAEIPNGEAGYAVTLLDGHDLSLIDSQTFVTEGDLGDFAGAARRMTAVLAAANAAGHIVMISSIHTPGQSRAVLANSSIPDEVWVELAAAVAEAGGTRHEFNVAAHDFSRDYSMVGRGGTGEGEGVDTASGGGARLRGALAPDNASLFGPVNTSAATEAEGAPADGLNQLLLMPPSDSWAPLSTDGARNALADLGCFVGLTDNPRARYADLQTYDLTNLKWTAADSAHFSTVRDSACSKSPYTAAEFTEAQDQLKQELHWVGNVRVYLGDLAYAYDNVSANAAAETQHLADYLKAELDADDKLGFDAMGFVIALINLAGSAVGDPDLGKQLRAMSGLVQVAKQFAITDYSGAAPDIESNPQIRADELAESLKDDAEAAVLSFQRMGDMIVSDPAKLQEVGIYGNCEVPCSVDPVYDEYATTKLARAKNIADLALERTIYEHLVTRAFVVYDLGLTANPTPANLICGSPTGVLTPFQDLDGNIAAPRRSWQQSLDEFHPSGAGSRWRVQIMVHRYLQWWYWPDKTLLDRMFNPVNVGSPDSGGLGIDRVDLLREATPRFDPSQTCSWEDG